MSMRPSDCYMLVEVVGLVVGPVVGPVEVLAEALAAVLVDL